MISNAARAALEEALGDRVRFDAPLSQYTSLRVGGAADVVATPTTRKEMAQLLAVCSAQHLRHTVLGGGFNTLVLGGGFEGVVIRMSRWRKLQERPGHRLGRFLLLRAARSTDSFRKPGTILRSAVGE